MLRMGSGALTLLLMALPAIAVPPRLSPEAIEQQRQQIPDWSTDGQKLVCTYQFNDFVGAVQFINRLLPAAEELGHHPDLTIAYNRVGVSVTTHDAGGLTDLDFDLAIAIRAASGDVPTAPRPCTRP